MTHHPPGCGGTRVPGRPAHLWSAFGLSIVASLAGCSSGSGGKGGAQDAGEESAATGDPETGPPEASPDPDSAASAGSCSGLCVDGAHATFACTSDEGPFTMQSDVVPSGCPNYETGSPPVCSPTQTSLNAQINFNGEELDCDGTIRSSANYPCTTLGTWSLDGATLTMTFTNPPLTATCTAQ
ncbi:MAG: hypothetical protein ACRELB_13865 [Polyangiaceae bacterium]